MASNNIEIGVIFNDKKAIKSINTLEKENTKLKNSLETPIKSPLEKYAKQTDGLADTSIPKLIKKFAMLTGVTLSFSLAMRSLIKISSESIGLYKEQIDAETKLEAALFATRYAVGITKDEMIKYSKELQRGTTFGDEMIVSAQSIFVTFTKIGKETFPRAIEAAADMSAMFGQDLKQSAIQLGTALNDPIAGIGRLKRIGISFTEEQNNSIQKFVEQNDIMSAQAVILDELSAEFGGVAKALSLTDIGKIAKLKNEISDLKEEIGVGLIPVYRKWLEIQKSIFQLFTNTTFKEQQDAINNSSEKSLVIQAERKNIIMEIAELEKKTAVEIKGNSQANNILKEKQIKDLKRLNDLKMREIDLAKQAAEFDNTTKTPPKRDFRDTAGAKGVKEIDKTVEELLKEEKMANDAAAKELLGIWDWYDDERRKQKVEEIINSSVAANKILTNEIETAEKQLDLIDKKAAAESEWARFRIDNMTAGLEKENAIIDINHKDRINKQKEFLESGLINQETYNSRVLELNELHEEELTVATEEAQRERLQNAANISAQFLGAAQNIADSVFEAQKNREDKELSNFQKLESDKISSLNVSNKRKAQLEKELQKELDKKKKEQFDKDKKRSIAMAIINGGVAVMMGYAQLGPIGGSIMAIVTAAATIAQVAVIASQSFANGGIVQNTQGIGIDKENAKLTPDEMVLTKSDQRGLLTGIRNGSLSGGPREIKFGDINISGNVTSDTVSQIKEAQMEQLSELQNNLVELRNRGLISESVLV